MSQNNAARQAAEALFAEFLKPVPKGKKEKRSQTAVIKPERIDVTKSEFFTLEERQYHIIEQECKTCGSKTKYALTKMLRYRARRRKDNLCIELPALLPEAIQTPSIIVETKEYSDFCAHCIEMARHIDNSTLFEMSSGDIKQGVLFK